MFKINWLGIVVWILRFKLSYQDITRLASSLDKHGHVYKNRALVTGRSSEEFLAYIDTLRKLDPTYYNTAYARQPIVRL